MWFDAIQRDTMREESASNRMRVSGTNLTVPSVLNANDHLAERTVAERFEGVRYFLERVLAIYDWAEFAGL
jgi:hypothetical protein